MSVMHARQNGRHATAHQQHLGGLGGEKKGKTTHLQLTRDLQRKKHREEKTPIPNSHVDQRPLAGGICGEVGRSRGVHVVSHPGRRLGRRLRLHRRAAVRAVDAVPACMDWTALRACARATVQLPASASPRTATLGSAWLHAPAVQPKALQDRPCNPTRRQSGPTQS